MSTVFSFKGRSVTANTFVAEIVMRMIMKHLDRHDSHSEQLYASWDVQLQLVDANAVAPDLDVLLQDDTSRLKMLAAARATKSELDRLGATVATSFLSQLTGRVYDASEISTQKLVECANGIEMILT